MSIIKRPLITEKANAQTEKGIYTFIVEKKANKIEIKKAIERAYGVNVDGVRTIRYAGKAKTRYSESRVLSGRTVSYKKAIVTLAEGEVIDFYGDI